MSIHSSNHPLNKYGRSGEIGENTDRLRATITEDFDVSTYPPDLFSYMFVDDDHPIYDALYEMLHKYRELGNYMRSEADTDSD